MKNKTRSLGIIGLSALALLLQACPENKAKTECKLTPQQDGTVKNECKSNKRVPDAGLDRSTVIGTQGMTSKGSFILFEVNKGLVLIDQEFTINVQIKTDQGYINRGKVIVVRSKSHESAARLILEPSGNIYAFVPKDIDKLDKLLASALTNTSKTITSDMNYSFVFKLVAGEPVKITDSDLKIWEKVPGFPLALVPTIVNVGKPPILRTPTQRIEKR